jgi:hypothetical protein
MYHWFERTVSELLVKMQLQQGHRVCPYMCQPNLKLVLLLLLLQAEAAAGVCEPVWWAQAGRQGVDAGGSASAGGSWSTLRGCGNNPPGERQCSMLGFWPLVSSH